MALVGMGRGAPAPGRGNGWLAVASGGPAARECSLLVCAHEGWDENEGWERGVESIGGVRKAAYVCRGRIATRKGAALTLLRAPGGSDDDALRGCGALNELFFDSSESS